MLLTTHHHARLILFLAIACTSSCVQVQPKPDFETARDLVEESTGRREIFDPYTAALTEDEINAILDEGLTLDEGLRLVLVNNRELQAQFQEIGIAHADWVQSQLLTNPSIDLLLRVPSDGGRSMIEAIVGGELLELWRIPVRTEAAQQNLEATILRIARRSGELIAETRKAYYVAVAAEELHGVARDNAALARRSFEAVKNLHEAGAADAFDENLARGPLLTAQLAIRTARIEAANAKRDLARMLSVERPVEDLQLTDPLPTLATTEFDPEALVQRALVSRLDLRAIDTAIKALNARAVLERRRAWGDVGAGVTVERPSGSGDPLVGPAFSLTLPIFDQNQAQVARAEFQLEQMVKLQESARVAVSQNVRSSADRAITASSNLAFYSEELLPQAQRSLGLAQESYAAGQTPLLALIEVQRQLVEARRGHVALRLEASTSSADLERVVGAVLSELHLE